MNRHRRSASWLRTVLGTVCALLAFALGAHAASDHRGALTEEFHQTYPITADGRVELDNINGDVHISSLGPERSEGRCRESMPTRKNGWMKRRSKIDSVRSDRSRFEPSIPDHDHTWNWGSHNNPASVEYTLTVPRTVRLDEIKLINGSLDVAGVSGEVNASLHQRTAGSAQSCRARRACRPSTDGWMRGLTSFPGIRRAEFHERLGGVDDSFGLESGD
jgi:hypothetical protein